MEMIERVARALVASDEAEPLFACACLGKATPADFACPCKMRAAQRRAKVAVEEMRKPSDEMNLAGIHAESFRSLGLLKVHHIWKAMIDAALKP